MDEHLCETLTGTILHGHVTCIKKLITNGSDVNITDTCGRSPLKWAAYYGREKFIEILVAAGANINGIDALGRSILHWAVGSQSKDCVRTLIDAGANPNIADNKGETPLHEVAWCGHHACIQTLISAGANPDVINIDGNTPLQLAVRRDYKKCVEVLVECILNYRALRNDEWDLAPAIIDLGHLLPVVMTRDGLDAAAKLVSRLPEEKRKVLENAMLCLSRFVSRDLVERIAVQCV